MSIVTNLKCTLAVTAGLCSSFAYAQKHPHVILIMTDQQRGDALGCMGNEAVISPNLDRLAGEGTLFMNGYSSCPSSTPARAGMLTGLSPWHHGMLGYGEWRRVTAMRCRACCVRRGIIRSASERCTGIRSGNVTAFMRRCSTRADGWKMWAL